MISWIFEFMVG